MAEHVEGPGRGESQPGETLPPDPATSRASTAAAARAATPDAAVVENLVPHWQDLPTPRAIPQPEVHWREVLSLLALVVLADITLFRTTGFAGPAAFLVVAPCLLALASPVATVSGPAIGVAVMIWLTAIRMMWQGSLLVGTAGALLVVAFGMTLAQRPPFLLETLGYALKSWLDASDSMGPYSRWLRQQYRRWPWLFSLHWILPLLTVAIFSAIFVAANPDLAQRVSELWSQILTRVHDFLAGFSITPLEVCFWAALAWYTIGVLRPSDWSHALSDIFDSNWNDVEVTSKETVNRPQPQLVTEMVTYGPYRNTLIAVSALFAVYLTFEFRTLWFRKFEKGFHFSGYAHEGAAWLTVALALATIVLSMIFRGPLLKDARLPKLKVWAWIWSFENLVLALAVYNRLWIYIGFNGMTRMRVIGILGITSVVVGFLLVLWKIARARGFVWLLRWQMLTVVFASYLYLILPVDWLVYSYNVRRILAGDPAPAVQITEHAISPEGILTLPPLMQSSNLIIRNGIHSLLEERARTDSENPNYRTGWTSHQLVHDQLTTELGKLPPADWTDKGSWERAMKWAAFKTYAYQWY